MALLTEVQQKEIPHEEGEWMALRKLSWKQLREAKRAREAEARGDMKEMGGEILGVIMGLGSDDERVQKGTRRYIADRQYAPDQYDTGLLLVAGVDSWSYDAEVNAESIDLLDEQTASWACRELLEMVRPSEEEEKNS